MEERKLWRSWKEGDKILHQIFCRRTEPVRKGPWGYIQWWNVRFCCGFATFRRWRMNNRRFVATAWNYECLWNWSMMMQRNVGIDEVGKQGTCNGLKVLTEWWVCDRDCSNTWGWFEWQFLVYRSLLWIELLQKDYYHKSWMDEWVRRGFLLWRCYKNLVWSKIEEEVKCLLEEMTSRHGTHGRGRLVL